MLIYILYFKNDFEIVIFLFWVFDQMLKHELASVIFFPLQLIENIYPQLLIFHQFNFLLENKFALDNDEHAIWSFSWLEQDVTRP